MTLHDAYPDNFLRIVGVYPKWPTGRTKKRPAYIAYANANRVLHFTESDIQFIMKDIETRLACCVTWQPGNKFGPVSLAVYFNQRLWSEPYETVRRHRQRAVEDIPSTTHTPLTEEQRRTAQEALGEAIRGLLH